MFSRRELITRTILRHLLPALLMGTCWSADAARAKHILLVPSQFSTIQAAVDAASNGDNVVVFPGNYSEQVSIGKNLTLIGFGANSSIIQAPAMLVPDSSGRTSIVSINSGATVNMVGFTVTGPGSGSCLSGNALNRGIAVVEDATLNLSFAAVTHIHDTPIVSDCFRDGNAIGIGGLPFGGITGHATIFGVTISDYQASGIVLFNEGSTATISYNWITGPGHATAAFPAGIDFGFGAVARITHNVIRQNFCDSVDLGCGPDPINQFQSSGIGPSGAGLGTVISHNDVSDNDTGIYLFASTACCTVDHNKIGNNRYFGFVIQDGNNTSSHDQISGGRVGAAVVADSVDSIGTFIGDKIIGTSGEPVREISCCGFTATAIVKDKK